MSDLERDFEQALGKIAGGMFVVFLGYMASSVFHFLERLVLFRGLSKNDYGVMMLGVAIVEFAFILAELGLRSGSPRFISYYRGQKDDARVKGTVYATLKIGAVSSCAFALALFFSAGFLASLFDSQQLESVLRAYSVSLPFYVMVIILCSVFRGFDRVGVKAVFEDAVMWGLLAFFLLLAVATKSGLVWAAGALAAAAAITLFLLLVYSMRALPRLFETVAPVRMGRGLLLFSLPLAMEATLNVVLIWADTIMLGAYKTTEMVGAYNTAVPFATLLSVFMFSLMYIYLPVTTRLLSEGKKKQIRGIFRSSTKWAFTLTLPLLLIYILFPRQLIVFIAGNAYEEAWLALVIISLGVFVNVFVGPNGVTLVALGKSRLILFDSIVGVTVNLALNFLLIPGYGIEGAAFATFAALLVINVLKSVQIYCLEGIHPFTSRYLKPVLLAALGALATYPLFSWLLSGSSWFLVLLYPVYLTVALLMLLLSRSLEAEDVAVVVLVLTRLKIRPDRVKKSLSRFVGGESGRDGSPA